MRAVSPVRSIPQRIQMSPSYFILCPLCPVPGQCTPGREDGRATIDGVSDVPACRTTPAHHLRMPTCCATSPFHSIPLHVSFHSTSCPVTAGRCTTDVEQPSRDERCLYGSRTYTCHMLTPGLPSWCAILPFHSISFSFHFFHFVSVTGLGPVRRVRGWANRWCLWAGRSNTPRSVWSSFHCAPNIIIPSHIDRITVDIFTGHVRTLSVAHAAAGRDAVSEV